MAGETTEAYDERARVVGLLRHWALQLDGGMWAGVEPTHSSVLLMVADVFDGPRGKPPLAWMRERPCTDQRSSPQEPAPPSPSALSPQL